MQRRLAREALAAAVKAGSRLVLDGLLITGRGIQIPGPDRNDDERFAMGDLCDVTKITFEQGGVYRPGDYWIIPARVLTGDVEWPGVPDNPQFQSPHGPRHYYAPLAGRITNAAGAPEFADLRCCIQRLPCSNRNRVTEAADTQVEAVKTGGSKTRATPTPETPKKP